ncbi:MAG: hypothetical protein NT070_00755 [Cyanobacteria bacterium]|nr:hypothetical protein [Cyanobacteriota bacterium]
MVIPVGAFAIAITANRGCKDTFAIEVMANAIPTGGCANGVGGFALGFAAIGAGEGRFLFREVASTIGFYDRIGAIVNHCRGSRYVSSHL